MATHHPYGSGIFRRELSVVSTEDGAQGELIDDFHHFRARIRVRDDRIADVTGEAVRQPWSPCSQAALQIRRLVGMKLTPSLRAAGQFTPIKQQCTHLFDAAALAIARLGRRAGGVVYSIAIPDRIEGHTSASLARDGVTLLQWELQCNEITQPDRFAGHQIRGSDFAGWAEKTLDPEQAEATLLLQRACLISLGRAIDLDSYRMAGDVPGSRPGACFTYGDGVRERAARVTGSSRDFTHAAGRLSDEE